jgi:hypothetical protein
MKYSRNDESQADAVGAVILYKAGYNPESMVDFFKTMGAQPGAAPPELFSSPPNPGNRQQAIAKQIASWPAQNYVVDSPSFDKIHQHAMQVKTYTAQEIQAGAKSGQWAALNQRNGATFNPGGGHALPTSASTGTAPNTAPVSAHNVLPSHKMVSANLGPMKIHHPENWPVDLPDKQGEFVTIAPQAGITNNGVGYGVLLNGVAPPQGQRMSIDEITGQLVQHMEQNNGLEPRGKAQLITVAGIEGRSVFLQSPSPILAANGQPQKERDWLVTIPRSNGSVIFMIFAAPQSEFARFQPTYEAMVKSVQF